MNIDDKLICTHCGDECKDESVKTGVNVFCCTGCQLVYDLLNTDELSGYYDEIKNSGIQPKKFDENEFEFLDNEKVESQIIQFKIGDKSKVTFYIPQIYCSACLYLIENVHKLNSGILESKVNFLKKECSITYNNKNTTLRKIVELLTSIGYKPQLSLANIEKKYKSGYNKSLYLKIGIAAFTFGNVMLMALPEYLSGGNLEPAIKNFMGYLNLFFAILAFIAGLDYFKSAKNALKMKHINIDIPLSLGILVLFIRSIVDILFKFGSGYVDSLTGLVFFLLLGKLFQQKTYHTLSFQRDFTSYFPLSVLRKGLERNEYISIKDVRINDILIIRNNEIIPADSVLQAENTFIDYSFVTGESKPVQINKGEKIYSGGRQVGASIEVQVVKEFHQSYLTELWNNSAFVKEKESNISYISNTLAKYFTIVILIIAFGSLFYWVPKDFGTAMNVFTAVLIIACPCALALTTPFTYGTALRVLGRNNLFLKNEKIVEYLASIKKTVFDKTGTLTQLSDNTLEYLGDKLDEIELSIIKTCTQNSTHPLSKLISDCLDSKTIEIKDFEEIAGKGIEAHYKNYQVKIGNKKWFQMLGYKFNVDMTTNNDFTGESQVFIAINNVVKGYYAIKSSYRDNIQETIRQIKSEHEIFILSGDNDSEQEILKEKFGNQIKMKFNQLPEDKLHFIENLQNEGSKVLMIGDGLNDAGALKQSDVGIAVTENTSNFTPGSDAILLADNLKDLPKFFKLAKRSVRTVYYSLIISLIYHTIGFYFALQGELTPLVAAIFMPVSSVTVVLFTVGRVSFFGWRLKL